MAAITKRAKEKALLKATKKTIKQEDINNVLDMESILSKMSPVDVQRQLLKSQKLIADGKPLDEFSEKFHKAIKAISKDPKLASKTPFMIKTWGDLTGQDTETQSGKSKFWIGTSASTKALSKDAPADIMRQQETREFLDPRVRQQYQDLENKQKLGFLESTFGPNQALQGGYMGAMGAAMPNLMMGKPMNQGEVLAAMLGGGLAGGYNQYKPEIDQFAGQAYQGMQNLGNRGYQGMQNLGSMGYQGAQNLGSQAYQGAGNVRGSINSYLNNLLNYRG